MPLKHDTETFLVFLLGFLIALAGIVAAFLPPLSLSIVPWATAFALSIAYPLVLYPLFRRRRADNVFRLLHFSPALLLFGWVVLELLAAARPGLQYLQTWYTASWSLAGVLLFLFLLALFCLSVLRQRFSRMALLLVVLVPFLLFSRMSDRGEWDRRLTAAVWDGGRLGTGFVVAQSTSSNLQPSSDPAEEEWRTELRRMEQRRRELQGTGGTLSGFRLAGAIRGAGLAAGRLAPSEDSLPPPRLPTSGFGAEGAALVLLAAFCTALHRRTMARRDVGCGM